MGSGLPWDVCNRNTCRAWGDPHVDGFDGNRNDVYGGAIYSLSETTGLGFTHLARYGLDNVLRSDLVLVSLVKIILKIHLVCHHSKLQWRRAKNVTWHLSKNFISLFLQILASQLSKLRSPSRVTHISHSMVVLTLTSMLRSVSILMISFLIGLDRDQIRINWKLLSG